MLNNIHVEQQAKLSPPPFNAQTRTLQLAESHLFDPLPPLLHGNGCRGSIREPDSVTLIYYNEHYFMATFFYDVTVGIPFNDAQLGQ